MVEVEVDARRRDQGEPQRRRALEARARRRRRRSASTGSAGHRRVEVAHAQRDALERAALARALGVEQRQLAELGVDADERERVGLLDHVHAEVVAEEAGQRLALVTQRATWSRLLGAEVDHPTSTPPAAPAIASRSSSLSVSSAAATFSSRCSTDEVPGIGSITGERASSQASATWPGVASWALRDLVERTARPAS